MPENIPYYTPNAKDGTDFIIPVSEEQLLRGSDVVSIHCPLNNSRGILERTAMEMMKSGAYLINVARGGIVDEEALDWALTSGWPFGRRCPGLHGKRASSGGVSPFPP